MNKLFFIGLSLITSSFAFATPKFTNITSSDFEDISKDMSANFMHNSMLGASKMGTIFGFQLGIVGAQTASSKTNEIVKRNAGAELPNLYNAGLVAAVGIPFGIAFEGVFFPEASLSGLKFSETSLGLKYNINGIIPILPINVALRGIYSTAKFSFDQTVNSISSTVEINNSVSGLQLLISPMLPIVEPYIGVGILNGSNKLSATGSSSIFDTTYTTSQSDTKNVTSTQLLAGVELNLLLIKFGAEYSQAFGTNRIGAKIAIGF
ncbi:MAG: DUF6588 family protein [Pseudobdellovibrionaceae bacterium]